MSRDGFRMGQVDLEALRRGTGGRAPARLGELMERENSLLPSLWDAIPGLQRNDAVALPETDDPEALGGDAGRVVAESQQARRDRVAQERALERLRAAEENLPPLFNEDGSPMVQPERGLGPQLGVRSVDDIALEEFAESPGASAALSMGEVLPLPLSRVLTGAASAAQGGSYDDAQRELDRLLAEGREESPVSSMAGMGAGMLPQLAAAPVIAASSPLLARLGPAGARIAAGTLEGMLSANAQDAAARRPLSESSVPTAAMLGIGFGSAAEGAGQLVDMARRSVPSLESFADLMRVRGSAGRTLPQMRAIDDLPGGIPAAARDLREMGISPRGSVHSMDTAAERAAGVNARASRDLGRVFDEMSIADEAADAITNSPRNAALEAVELDDPGLLYPPASSADDRIRREILDARIARSQEASRAQARSHLEQRVREAAADTLVTEPPVVQQAGTSTRVVAPRNRPRPAEEPLTPERILGAIDRGQVTGIAEQPEFRGFVPRPTMPERSPQDTDRLRALVDELLPQRRTGTVALDEVLGVLDDRARTYEPLPSGAGPRAAVRGMADDYRSTGGRMTFRSAQDEKQLLDQAINYNPNTNPVNPRASVQQDDVRAARQALQREMDAAVQRHDPELGAMYPRARRTHQLSGIVGRVSDDAALRDAANRQLGQSDYMSRPQDASVFEMKSWPSIIGNRLLRGREATIGAAGAERLSDALQAMPDMRAGGQRAARMGALPAGQPAQAPRAPAPAARAPDGMSQADFAALPVMDASEIPEFSDEELGELPELSEDEINALPVMEAP